MTYSCERCRKGKISYLDVHKLYYDDPRENNGDYFALCEDCFELFLTVFMENIPVKASKDYDK